jgi:hypothetical protein
MSKAEGKLPSGLHNRVKERKIKRAGRSKNICDGIAHSPLLSMIPKSCRLFGQDHAMKQVI